jgi:hypothetical protein
MLSADGFGCDRVEVGVLRTDVFAVDLAGYEMLRTVRRRLMTTLCDTPRAGFQVMTTMRCAVSATLEGVFGAQRVSAAVTRFLMRRTQRIIATGTGIRM